MTAGSGTVADIRDAVHIHPALSEVVDRAFSGQFSRGGGGRPPPPFVTRHRMATRRRRHTSAGGFCTGAFIREYDGKSSNRDSRWQRIARRLRSPRERTEAAAKEFAETEGDELELIFDGAGTQWIPELEDEESDYHELYQAVRDDAAVCDYCSGVRRRRRRRRLRTRHPRRVRRTPERPLARRRRLRDHHVLSGRRLIRPNLHPD